MKNLIKVGFLSMLIFSVPCFSEANRNEASMGTSYMISMFSYGFYKEVLHVDPVPAFIFSVAASLAIGMSSDWMNPHNTSNQLNQSFIYRNIGNISAGATILMFRF